MRDVAAHQIEPQGVFQCPVERQVDLSDSLRCQTAGRQFVVESLRMRGFQILQLHRLTWGAIRSTFRLYVSQVRGLMFGRIVVSHSLWFDERSFNAIVEFWGMYADFMWLLYRLRVDVGLAQETIEHTANPWGFKHSELLDELDRVHEKAAAMLRQSDIFLPLSLATEMQALDQLLIASWAHLRSAAIDQASIAKAQVT
jgi:hypothetical protein